MVPLNRCNFARCQDVFDIDRKFRHDEEKDWYFDCGR
jgi:hypothetical protein